MRVRVCDPTVCPEELTEALKLVFDTAVVAAGSRDGQRGAEDQVSR